jgi:hypothetical protein
MMRVLSLGAGVQSTTLALMAAVGELEPPDCAIFADTGWEPAAVYTHLAKLEAALPFPVHHVSRGNLRDDMIAKSTAGKGGGNPPFFIRNADGSKGILHRQCTRDYKVTPIKAWLRPFKAQGIEQWLGISTDEAHRMRMSEDKWIELRYPLIDAGMSRSDCIAWLGRAGWVAPKSSCIGCPYHSDAQWRTLTVDEMADAVGLERAIQAGREHMGIDGTPFLHASLKPLDEVNFSTWAERGQGDLFGEECTGLCGV